MKNKLNNKGYMLVEIILASSLAFGLAYFLIDLTLNLKNKNDDLLVKTLVITDQAIITNIIMDKLDKEAENFECSDIKINGNVFTLGDKTNIISDYATVGDVNCEMDSDDNITINIPITVEQLPDIDFDVKINYAKSYLSG